MNRGIPDEVSARLTKQNGTGSRRKATQGRVKIFPKEINGWFKALEIAEVLFWEEGYHQQYLNDINNFIRRKTMYSPKIQPELIPGLYHRAKTERVPMTKLIDRIIRGYLEATKQKDAEPTTSRDSTTASF